MGGVKGRPFFLFSLFSVVNFNRLFHCLHALFLHPEGGEVARLCDHLVLEVMVRIGGALLFQLRSDGHGAGLAREGVEAGVLHLGCQAETCAGSVYYLQKGI